MNSKYKRHELGGRKGGGEGGVDRGRERKRISFAKGGTWEGRRTKNRCDNIFSLKSRNAKARTHATDVIYIYIYLYM